MKRVVLTEKKLDALVYWMAMGAPNYREISTDPADYETVVDAWGDTQYLFLGNEYSLDELKRLALGQAVADQLREAFLRLREELGDEIYDALIDTIT